MTLEQTISAVEEIINQHRVEIPDGLQKTVASRAHSAEQRYGYFNGREVVSNLHTFRLTIKRISKSSDHYLAEFSTNGSNELIFVNVDDLDEFCEKITDIQDIAIV